MANCVALTCRLSVFTFPRVWTGLRKGERDVVIAASRGISGGDGESRNSELTFHSIKTAELERRDGCLSLQPVSLSLSLSQQIIPAVGDETSTFLATVSLSIVHTLIPAIATY